MVQVCNMIYKNCYAVDSLKRKLNNCIQYYYYFYLELVFIHRYDIDSVPTSHPYLILYSNDTRDGHVTAYLHYMWRIHIPLPILYNKMNML